MPGWQRAAFALICGTALFAVLSMRAARPDAPDAVLLNDGRTGSARAVQARDTPKRAQLPASTRRPAQAPVGPQLETGQGTPPKVTELPVAIVVPSKPGGVCLNGERLARFSVNAQTVMPSRVIVGIATLGDLDSRAKACLDRFRELLQVPLTVAVGRAMGAAGASRNFALEQLQEGEAALMHDDDEFIHPQAVEFVQWSFARHPGDDVLTMAYLWEWGTRTPGAPTPWCIGQDFTTLYTTTELQPDRPGSNVHLKSSVVRPRCRNLHHAYPAFRSSPLRRFGVRYNTHRNRNEDGQFLQALLDAGANMRFTCFPVVGYRSQNPTSTNTASNVCPCWMGFARCDTEFGMPDPYWLAHPYWQ